MDDIWTSAPDDFALWYDDKGRPELPVINSVKESSNDRDRQSDQGSLVKIDAQIGEFDDFDEFDIPLSMLSQDQDYLSEPTANITSQKSAHTFTDFPKNILPSTLSPTLNNQMDGFKSNAPQTFAEFAAEPVRNDINVDHKLHRNGNPTNGDKSYPKNVSKRLEVTSTPYTPSSGSRSHQQIELPSSTSSKRSRIHPLFSDEFNNNNFEHSSPSTYVNDVEPFANGKGKGKTPTELHFNAPLQHAQVGLQKTPWSKQTQLCFRPVPKPPPPPVGKRVIPKQPSQHWDTPQYQAGPSHFQSPDKAASSSLQQFYHGQRIPEHFNDFSTGRERLTLPYSTSSSRHQISSLNDVVASRDLDRRQRLYRGVFEQDDESEARRMTTNLSRFRPVPEEQWSTFVNRSKKKKQNGKFSIKSQTKSSSSIPNMSIKQIHQSSQIPSTRPLGAANRNQMGRIGGIRLGKNKMKMISSEDDSLQQAGNEENKRPVIQPQANLERIRIKQETGADGFIDLTASDDDGNV